MRVLVCGSRRFTNPFTVSLAIDERIARLPERSTVIHGAANGADKIAAEAAVRHGHRVNAFEADWDRYGKRAGVIRNIRMLNSRPELVIAFWDGQSRGTAHTIREAQRRGIPVEVLSA